MTLLELTLSKILELRKPTTPPLANARRQAKYSLQFLICAHHQKILLNKEKGILLGSASVESGDGAGLYFCSRETNSNLLGREFLKNPRL